MNIYEYMDNNGFVTLILSIPALIMGMFSVWVCLRLAYIVLFRLPNRMFRCVNICLRGYPPENCDADGDFRPLPEVREVEEESTK